MRSNTPDLLRLIVAVTALGLAAASAAPAAPKRRAAASSTNVPAPDLRDRLARVEAALEAERLRLRIPGLAVAVVENDRVVLLKGFGVRSLETGEPVDSGTVFPIGSCTKAFTAMAAVISQEDGRLSLDDSPRDYLPWFHMADPEANRLVSLRDMLSHRTGLKAYADLAAEPAVLMRHEYLRAATGARPVARLREKFQYSNAMYVAVGEIVAKTQRSSWEHVIERRIFGPLGMTSSLASAFDLPRVSDRAIGYDDSNHPGTWKPVSPPASLQTMAPAGSIASSARDMARWVRFLLAEGSIDGTHVVSAAGVREVTTPHMRYRGFAKDGQRVSIEYGLGWALYDWKRHRVVEHNGGSSGISALVSLMPERRTGFVLLINTSPTSLTGITRAGKILWPILLGEREASEPAPAVSTALPDSAPLDSLDLPTADTLLPKMLAAAGGERNLLRHATLEMRCRKRYLNQGVEADVNLKWRAPDRLVTHEAWTAAGKSIGGVRVYFDGAQGGQETTFGQDAIYTGQEAERARRDASLAWLADPHKQYPGIRVLGRRSVGGEEAFLLRMTSAGGGTTQYAVSARTLLIVQKTSGGAVESYSDFRSVGGVVQPFRTVIADHLGETELTVLDARYDAPVPTAAFAPRVSAPRVPAPRVPAPAADSLAGSRAR